MTGPASEPIRVLMVEDKEDDFSFVRLLLSKRTLRHYELEWAPTYEAGRAALVSGRHDVGLFDHNLGLKTGVALLREASALGIAMPIILLTGADSLEVDQEAAEWGAADYLAKAQLDTVHLERSIRYALRHARTLAERRVLEKELLTISDEEKRRIGADLHDGLGQYLTGIACLVTALRDRLKAEGSGEVEKATHIAGLVNASLERTRLLARGLCPVQVEQSGLYAALQDLAFQAERLHGVHCRFRNGGLHLAFEPDDALHVYRIAQEAVHNAIRHGGADRIVVRLETAEAPRLVVEDNGCGFDPLQQAHHRGLGLHLMRQRASLLGGAFEIGPVADGTGTRVECTLPKLNSSHESRDKIDASSPQ
ncbi:MAG: ATP-binding protein [Opitutaceae bacterium]